jgi:lincosamide nucleotidyltransferase
MNKGELLLKRLEEIAASLQRTDVALALLGLGSVGLETGRLDEYSDLDFFVVVRDGSKAAFVESLEWLERVCPIAFAYRNTPDGQKALFDDGVFCEFAVFEARELSGIPFAPGRVVWKREGFDQSVCAPSRTWTADSHSAEWLLGEALSGLYVGLCRLRRGETLAAFRAIQVQVVGHVIELARTLEPATAVERDPFAEERRFERRYPGVAAELPSFMRGYDGSRASALAILTFLESRFEVNAAMAAVIRALCEGRPTPT